VGNIFMFLSTLRYWPPRHVSGQAIFLGGMVV